MAPKQEKTILEFHQGTLLLKGLPEDVEPPFFLWDDRSRQWRAKALYYADIVGWLRGNGWAFEDRSARFKRQRLTWRLQVQLRPYQKEAFTAWVEARGRGTVCLPTGTGKSWVALKAMRHAQTSTLVVLPTLDLMNQWYELISDAFGIQPGILGGGYHDVRPVTVTTYDSAYIHVDKYGDRFGLVIFDEVHHLPAATYSHIPEMSVAPFRLGLTATYQRLDGLHGKLERLVGPVVYEKNIRDLEGLHLAEYETVRIGVQLTPAEKRAYQHNWKIYQNYVRERGIKFYSSDLKPLLETAFDPEGRKAFLARLRCRRIMVGAARKLEVLESLLKRHHGDRILVFTESNDLVYEISEAFLIPALTHHTKTVERKEMLERFRSGVYSVIVTSKVLNEGVDVPNANVAIVLSGSASPVEHTQRLGRILRKREDKHAVLYELVTRGTQESQISYRRRRSDAYK